MNTTANNDAASPSAPRATPETDAHADVQLSALVDGELEVAPARFLLKRLGHDAELRGAFARHYVVRACMRRSTMALLPAGFAARVVQALADEAVPRRGFGTALRWSGGAAVAASVALLALIAARPAGEPVPDTVASPAIVSAGAVTEAPVREQDLRPDFSRVGAQTVAATQSREIGRGINRGFAGDPQLESYLVRHNQALQAQGRASFVPYVHLVATPVEGTVRVLAPDGSR